MAREIDRRQFLKTAGLAGAAAALPMAALAEEGPAQPGPDAAVPAADQALPADALPLAPEPPPEQQIAAVPPPPPPQPTDHPAGRARVFFTAPEAAFVTAAVDRLIPPDDAAPGAVDAGVVVYIDRQLAGAFGRGARMYLAGPWPDGALPTQGYQLPLTPAEVYRLAIAEIDKAVAKTNQDKHFADLAAQQQDAVLQSLDKGEMKLDTVPGKLFFDLLLANAREGYFADPAYGGNLNAASWKMIGFPGARGHYADDMVSYRNKPFGEEPIKLADLQ